MVHQSGVVAGRAGRATVDLAVLPQGHTYEDQYRGFLRVFEQIASVPGGVQIVARNAPWSWVPLLEHLNCIIAEPRVVFEHCLYVKGALLTPLDRDRTFVEVMTNFRPETADALWKIDMQWSPPPGRVRTYPPFGQFIVTTNGSFHRPEVLEYIGRLNTFTPTKRKVLLVPCAADKPYPSAMHSMCQALIPDDWYIMNATGVVGLVPQDLWDVMPHYDSAIPNRWRLFEAVKQYFAKHTHDRVIVYCDFYSVAIKAAFDAMPEYQNRVIYPLPVTFYHDYIDLMKNENVLALRRALHAATE